MQATPLACISRVEGRTHRPEVARVDDELHAAVARAPGLDLVDGAIAGSVVDPDDLQVVALRRTAGRQRALEPLVDVALLVEGARDDAEQGASAAHAAGRSLVMAGAVGPRRDARIVRYRRGRGDGMTRNAVQGALLADRQFLRFLVAGGVNTLFGFGVNIGVHARGRRCGCRCWWAPWPASRSISSRMAATRSATRRRGAALPCGLRRCVCGRPGGVPPAAPLRARRRSLPGAAGGSHGACCRT